MARSIRTANKRRAARRRRSRRYKSALKHAQEFRRRVRNYGVLAVVLLLVAGAWYDKIAGLAQHALRLPDGVPLEAGIAGPAPPPASMIFEDAKDKGKGLVETITLVGSALSALAIGVGKVLDALNKGAEA